MLSTILLFLLGYIVRHITSPSYKTILYQQYANEAVLLGFKSKKLFTDWKQYNQNLANRYICQLINIDNDCIDYEVKDKCYDIIKDDNANSVIKDNAELILLLYRIDAIHVGNISLYRLGLLLCVNEYDKLILSNISWYKDFFSQLQKDLQKNNINLDKYRNLQTNEIDFEKLGHIGYNLMIESITKGKINW